MCCILDRSSCDQTRPCPPPPVLWLETAVAGKPITSRVMASCLHTRPRAAEQRSSVHFVWFKHFNYKLKAIRIYAFNLSMDNDIYMLHVPNILECRMLKVRMTRNTFKVHCYNKTTDFPQPPLCLKYLAYQVKRRLLCPFKFGYPLEVDTSNITQPDSSKLRR